MFTSEYSFVTKFLPLFQRFDNLTATITRRVRACFCGCVRLQYMCVCVFALMCGICAHVRAMRAIACACMRMRASASVRTCLHGA